MPFTILVVDDRVHDHRYAISRLSTLLRQSGYNVITEADSEKAFDEVLEHNPDLIVLDIDFGRSKPDGWYICKVIRAQGYRDPIVMRSEVCEKTSDGAKSYQSGANIFVRSDCQPEEILAAIRSNLPPPFEEFDERLCISFESERVCVKRGDVWQYADTQPLPFQLLRELVLNRGHILTSTELHLRLWGDEEVSDNRLTQCVSRLRHTIEIDPSRPRHIENVWGVGYRFNGKPTDSYHKVPERRQRCLMCGCR